MKIEIIGRYVSNSKESRYHIEQYSDGTKEIKRSAIYAPHEGKYKTDYTKGDLSRIVNPIWREITSGTMRTKITIVVEKIIDL